ncbi:MAG: lipoprotein [Hyphomicrobiales bacterium]|jgi:predicted small lipoprotein YifL
MKTLMIILAMSLCLAGCGIKGDPEPPPAATQAK